MAKTKHLALCLIILSLTIIDTLFTFDSITQNEPNKDKAKNIIYLALAITALSCFFFLIHRIKFNLDMGISGVITVALAATVFATPTLLFGVETVEAVKETCSPNV
ncbi:MAG: hypothetical protein HRK26_03910 [Rickettsiaceae bacterium H1]|nr:hypothetical protein [Rickettsiaceae bacterium H1]